MGQLQHSIYAGERMKGGIRRTAELCVCRTGAKEQFYTLYVEVMRVRTTAPKGVSYSSWFVQNLAHTKDDAIAKAEEIGTELDAGNYYDEIVMSFHAEPRPIYTRYEAFGDIEMKMAKSRKVWWGYANEEFWDMWKADKAAVKAAGYWPKRNEDGKWLLFRKVDAEEIEWRHE